jgi:hypothetical protein
MEWLQLPTDGRSGLLSAAECRGKARECAELARHAPGEASAALYEQLTLHWMEMAALLERMSYAERRSPEAGMNAVPNR